jgi:hypothetical protein
MLPTPQVTTSAYGPVLRPKSRGVDEAGMSRAKSSLTGRIGSSVRSLAVAAPVPSAGFYASSGTSNTSGVGWSRASATCWAGQW